MIGFLTDRKGATLLVFRAVESVSVNAKVIKRSFAGLFLAGVFLATGYFLFHSREPTYQGKPVSYWFREYCRDSPDHGGDYVRKQEALEALRHVGTNGVPYLVQVSFSALKPAPTLNGLSQALNDIFASRSRPLFLSANELAADAHQALQGLKPPAEQLLGLVHSRLSSTNQFEYLEALMILGTAGEGAEKAVPALTNAFRNSIPMSAAMAIQSLGWIGPPARSAVPALTNLLTTYPGPRGLGLSVMYALGKIGSNAAPAVPAVQSWFDRETNMSWKCEEATALFRMDAGQTPALDFLIDHLTNGAGGIDGMAVVRELGEIGPSAKAAVPYLLQAMQGTNVMLVAQAPSALAQMGASAGVILPALKQCLQSKDETMRINAAARVLELAPADHDAHLLLMNAIQGGSVFRNFAISTLGNAGPAAKEAIPVLRGVLKDGNRYERDSAKQALRRIEEKR
jgi:hypothetical protein